MTIVSNTSPISNLAAIGQLSLLQHVYGSIIIPHAVADKIAKVATIYVQASSVPHQPWILIQKVSNTATVERLRKEKLDAGESEAIALALELNANSYSLMNNLEEELLLTKD